VSIPSNRYSEGAKTVGNRLSRLNRNLGSTFGSGQLAFICRAHSRSSSPGEGRAGDVPADPQ
jgi:hypothetical protein